MAKGALPTVTCSHSESHTSIQVLPGFSIAVTASQSASTWRRPKRGGHHMSNSPNPLPITALRDTEMAVATVGDNLVFLF